MADAPHPGEQEEPEGPVQRGNVCSLLEQLLSAEQQQALTPIERGANDTVGGVALKVKGETVALQVYQQYGGAQFRPSGLCLVVNVDQLSVDAYRMGVDAHHVAEQVRWHLQDHPELTRGTVLQVETGATPTPNRRARNSISPAKPRATVLSQVGTMVGTISLQRRCPVGRAYATPSPPTS